VIRLLLVTALVGGLGGLVSSARGEEVSPRDGLQIKLGPMNVSIYYETTDAGYQVVTTASSEAADSAIRFISALVPGQDVVVSVPRSVGEAALELHVRRVGDRVELIRPTS